MTVSKCKGSCLCGAAEYEISGHINIFQHCHCSRCRKFTGSAFASNLFVRPVQFRWLKENESITRFEPIGTKYFATTFCNVCGSSLPWLSKNASVVIIPAGTLDDDLDIKPSQNIHCASAASWYRDTGGLPKYDELPPRGKR